MKLNFPNNLKSKIHYDFNLSKSTWFQTDSKVDIFCNVHDTTELKKILKIIPEEIPILIIGVGSNILIRKGGFRGVIIKLVKDFSKISINEKSLIVGSGVLDSTLAKFAYENSIKNLEFYIGIPGTIGGAIKMNAGCYGNETKDVVKKAIIIDRFGNEKEFYIDDLKFNYRSSIIDDTSTVKEVFFNLEKGEKENIKNEMNSIIKNRHTSQPLNQKTGGSTFKNPPGLFAAKLIEDSGCKNLQIGDAKVSDKHANFLINLNNASAKDIEDLGNKIRDRVYKKFSVLLEWEIKIFGNHE